MILGSFGSVVKEIWKVVRGIFRKIFGADYGFLLEPIPHLNFSLLHVIGIILAYHGIRRNGPKILDFPLVALRTIMVGFLRSIPKVVLWCLKRILIAIWFAIKSILKRVFGLSIQDGFFNLRDQYYRWKLRKQHRKEQAQADAWTQETLNTNTKKSMSAPTDKTNSWTDLKLPHI